MMGDNGKSNSSSSRSSLEEDVQTDRLVELRATTHSDTTNGETESNGKLS